MIIRHVFLLIIIILLPAFFISYNSRTIVAESRSKGPRQDDLAILFYSDVLATYAALKAGEVDVVASELTSSLYDDAIADPNVLLAPVADMGTYQFDINNNWTIATYPGTRSPTSYQSFRQAIALLVDKRYILGEICGGLAERIDQPLGAPQEGWMNSSYCDPNYPYEYDPVAAAALLDSAGFGEGSTPNPYYDAAFPGSTMYTRTYPPGHETAGADIDPVITYVRTDDPRRFQAGRHLYGNMRKIGIPVDPREGPSSYTYVPVMDLMDYHIYTGRWSLGRFPTSLYELFHSSFWFSWSSNYVTGMNASNLPNYPSLDNLLYGLRHSETNEEAKSICKNALGYFTELCVNIPLWSSVSYWAYSSSVLGVVNMEGKGLENGYSFMNAYKSDGSPIRIGTVAPPNAMNILHSSYYSDYQNLDRMNLYGGVATAPYDLSVDQAGFVRDWETTTWFDAGDGESKTKLTVWFRDDAYFVEPVTGNQKAQVNATHFAFSAWYEHATVDSWHYPKWENVHHIDIVDPYTVNIYFDSLSFWNTYYANGPILPIDTWLQPPLAYQVTEIFTEGVDTTTPGVIGLSGVPVWIKSVTADDAPLTMFTDYNIINGQLEILTALPPGSIIEVSYWYVGDSHGFTPDNLPWPTIFEGAGMYYCTAFTPGAGGYLTLKANPFFWLETPPLGEVDWKGYWQGTVKPRNGYFHVCDADLDMVEAALGSSGTSTPDANWHAGCDLAEPAGYVDVYDFCVTYAVWCTTFGWPAEVAGVPVASFSFRYDSPINDLTVHFDASSSFHTDPEGSIISWDWEFGDGETGSGETITHVYASTDYPNNKKKVTLTVTDDIGQKDNEEIIVVIGNLIADSIVPIQDIWKTYLIENKATDFSLHVTSTFEKIVQAHIRIDAPGFTPNTYTTKSKISFSPGLNKIFLGTELMAVKEELPVFNPGKPSVECDFLVDPLACVDESHENDNQRSGGLRPVISTRPLKILFVLVHAENQPNAYRIKEGEARSFINDARNFLASTYPLADDHLTCDPPLGEPFSKIILPQNEKRPSKWVLKKLSEYAGSYDRVVGVASKAFIKNYIDSEARGLTSDCPLGKLSCLVEAWPAEGWIVAHELGHTFGLGDDYLDPNNPDDADMIRQEKLMPLYEIKFCETGRGYNVQFRVEVPDVPSFMHNEGFGSRSWVSKRDYEYLVDYLREKVDPAVLVVSGLIYENNSARFSKVCYLLSEGNTTIEEGAFGNYTIALLDAGGQPLSQVRFNATFLSLTNPPTATNESCFCFKILWMDETRVVQLQNASGSVLDTRNVSLNAPSVTVLFPNGGELLHPGTNYPITWSAQDADGDVLIYNVYISGDTGVTWAPIITGIEDTSYSFDFSGVSGGSEFLVRVEGTDGINTGEDSSDEAFTICSFSMLVDENIQTIKPTETASYSLNITSHGGFSDPTVLSVSELQADNFTFNWVIGPTVITPPDGSATATLEVQALNTTIGGLHLIVIEGSSGNKTQFAVVRVFVVIHDTATTNVEYARSVVGIGYSLFINATVENHGFYLESCSISLFCNQSALLNQTIYLHAGTCQTLVFEWNTAGFAKGNYTIIVQVDPVQNETLTTDNTAINGPIFLTIPGDVDADADVDIFDIVCMATIYGVVEPDPEYDPNCDIDGDGDIDIFDIVAAASYYGESW